MDIEDPEQISIRIETSKISTWNNAGRPTGAEGQIGFNTETSKLEIYDGSSWQTIAVE